MNVRLDTEIHFHEQDVVSIYSDDFSSSQNDEKIGVIATAVLFALRNLSNLNGHESADKLARVLTDAPKLIEQYASNSVDSGFQLVQYPGNPGRKRFLVSLRLSEATFNFKMKPKGFGFLSTGIGYYVPVAMLAYLRKQALAYCKDQEFLGLLGNSMRACGSYHLNRQITLSNQMQLGGLTMAPVVERYT